MRALALGSSEDPKRSPRSIALCAGPTNRVSAEGLVQEKQVYLF